MKQKDINMLLKHFRKAFFTFSVFFCANIDAQKVDVSVNGGASTAATYPTISSAFNAINLGTHTGNIILTIVGDTFEPFTPVALRKSGFVTGSNTSSYGSVLIRPNGTRKISGFPNPYRGIVEIFGGANVVIDGDNPNVAGVSRDLTFEFLATTANADVSCIRLGSVVGDTLDNITVKNCILRGGRPNSTATNVSFGIVVANWTTNSPLLQASNVGSAAEGLILDNNEIYKALYGIALNGGTTAGNEFSNITISNNKIGVTSNANDLIGSASILLRYSSLPGRPSFVVGNEVMTNIPGGGLGIETIGIDIQGGNRSLTIDKNYIHDIVNNLSTTGVNVVGLRIAGVANTDIKITNNIIRDVISARKTGSIGANLNYGLHVTGTCDNMSIQHNTIGLIQPNTSGSTSGYFTAATYFNTTSPITDFINNIVVNNNVSSASTLLAIQSTGFNNTLSENNCFYAPSGVISNLAASLSAWQFLNGKDLNSFIEYPKFISATDLHIQNNAVSKLESGARGTSITQDIDYENRPSTSATGKDIGADEFNGRKYIKPTINVFSHTPTKDSCDSYPRTIITNSLDTGNALDSVMLEYRFNAGTKTYVRMTYATGGVYFANIPAASPTNAVVAYRVFCVTSLGDTVTSNYNYYTDNRGASAMLPSIISDPAYGCPGSRVNLIYSYPPDPTGVNFPPKVDTAAKFSDLTNVTFRTINNTTTMHSLAGNLGTATGTAGAYSNFRDKLTPTVQLGRSYPISMTSTNTSSIRDYFAAFVDFNGDGDFIDADEMVFNSIYIPTVGGRTENGNVFITATARPGKTTMRCMVSNQPILNAFSTIPTGEVEDYTIQILPHKITWIVNGADSGTMNPKSILLPSSFPVTASVYLQDSATCANSTSDINITSSASTSLSVTLVGSNTACYGTPRIYTAVPTGGCPPYSYDWSPNNSNTNTNTIVLNDTSIEVSVTVFDKDGQSYSAYKTVTIDTPRLGAVFASAVVCNRGPAILNANITSSKDSVFWYDNPFGDPYSFLYRGKPYTTPSLNATKDFYAAAFRSDGLNVGRANLTGATSGSSIVNNAGIRFTTTESIVIQRCSLYIAGTAASKINIAVLDKYGSIVTQTGDFTPPFNPGGAGVPTVVNLNFILPNPAADYKLAVINMSGITTFNRNTGVGYPISSGTGMTITGSYNQSNPTSTDYFYFYNILIQKNLCVGPKKLVKAIVTEPIVPKVNTDMVFTQVCRNSPAQLFFVPDTFGNRFVWYKDGAIWQDVVAGIPQDTSTKTTRSFAAVQPNDTGYYQVRIFSSKFCTRDTFTREVKLAIFPEAKVTRQPPSVLNMCVTKDGNIDILAQNTATYKWNKVFPTSSIIQTSTSNVVYFGNVSFADSGLYKFTVHDINNCIPDTSIQVRVVIHDTPQLVSNPIDSVLCLGEQYIIRAKIKNATQYQWYKDNGIMPFFVRDSIQFYSLAMSDSGVYRLYGSSYAGCPTIVTNYGRIGVIPSPQINAFYNDIKTCEGNKLRVNASATLQSGFQWYKSDTFYSGLDNKTDSMVINPVQLTDTGKYYFKALSTNKCPSKTSDTFYISVVKKATVSGNVLNSVKCEGDKLQAAYNTTDGNYYQWYKNSAAVQSQSDSILNLVALGISDSGTYYLRVTSDPVCPEVISSSFKLNVSPAPVILVQPIGDTLCKGSNHTMKISAKHISGYTWYNGSTVQSGNNDSTFKILNLGTGNEGDYSVLLSPIAPCAAKSSDVASVRVISGAAKAHLTLVSNYNAVEQCTDDKDWTYYAMPDKPEEFIFAVRKNGSEFIGKADVFLRPVLFENISNSVLGYNGSILLNRYWNLKIDTGAITNPVDVKFYYLESETDKMENKKKDYELTNKKDTSFKFENSEINWIVSDSIPFNNNLLRDSIKGNKLNFKHEVLTGSELGIENNLNYIIFYGIKNIGGGTGVYTYKAKPRILNSINENDPLSTSIYPNPNDGNFSLQLFSKDLGDIELEVFNSLGQRVYENSFKIHKSYSELPIKISGLANGIYQLNLTRGDQRISLKLQIEN